MCCAVKSDFLQVIAALQPTHAHVRTPIRAACLQRVAGSSTARAAPSREASRSLALPLTLPAPCARQALESLLERPGAQRFDYILIETSGLANPGPVATAL
jgi:hypothetical protein